LPSTNPDDARLDPESIRVSNNGQSVFISDEYRPYVYEFNRMTPAAHHGINKDTGEAAKPISGKAACCTAR
jgi:hypothetical protein